MSSKTHFGKRGQLNTHTPRTRTQPHPSAHRAHTTHAHPPPTPPLLHPPGREEFEQKDALEASIRELEELLELEKQSHLTTLRELERHHVRDKQAVKKVRRSPPPLAHTHTLTLTLTLTHTHTH